MSFVKDDNDNEQKNIDTYKIIGDQMARLVLNFDNKDKIDDTNLLITYDDLASKTPNFIPNSSLKTSGGDNKSKGKVKFGQIIKTSSLVKTDTKKILNNKSNKSLGKPQTSKNNSEQNLPFFYHLNFFPTILNQFAFNIFLE